MRFGLTFLLWTNHQADPPGLVQSIEGRRAHYHEHGYAPPRTPPYPSAASSARPQTSCSSRDLPPYREASLPTCTQLPLRMRHTSPGVSSPPPRQRASSLPSSPSRQPAPPRCSPASSPSTNATSERPPLTPLRCPPPHLPSNLPPLGRRQRSLLQISCRPRRPLHSARPCPAVSPPCPLCTRARSCRSPLRRSPSSSYGRGGRFSPPSGPAPTRDLGWSWRRTPAAAAPSPPATSSAPATRRAPSAAQTRCLRAAPPTSSLC